MATNADKPIARDSATEEELTFLAKRRARQESNKDTLVVRKYILDEMLYDDTYPEKVNGVETGKIISLTKIDWEKFCAFRNEAGASDEFIFEKIGWKSGGTVKITERV